MPFSWILFDADHTLFDFDRSARESLEETLISHGVPHHPEHWDRYNTINKHCWEQYETGRIDRETMRYTRFTRFFEEINHKAAIDINTFSSQYLNGLPTRPYFNDGAIDLLQAFHGRIKMGIITNGLTEVQRPRMTSTGIDRYFEIIIVSGEIGFLKPDHAFFNHTHEVMGKPEKSSVLVVGDSLTADIRGGLDFGFQTCWYNPGGLANHTAHQPHFIIDALEKLPAIVNLV